MVAVCCCCCWWWGGAAAAAEVCVTASFDPLGSQARIDCISTMSDAALAAGDGTLDSVAACIDDEAAALGEMVGETVGEAALACGEPDDATSALLLGCCRCGLDRKDTNVGGGGRGGASSRAEVEVEVEVEERGAAPELMYMARDSSSCGDRSRCATCRARCKASSSRLWRSSAPWRSAGCGRVRVSHVGRRSIAAL